MNGSKRLATGLLAVQLAALIAGLAVVAYLRLPGAESWRYVAESMAFSRDGVAGPRMFREWRKTGNRIFDACLDETGQPIDTVYGELKSRAEGYLSFVVVGVSKRPEAQRCSYMVNGYPGGLGLYEGEVVQLRRLPAEGEAMCFYHYEGDVARCYGKQ